MGSQQGGNIMTNERLIKYGHVWALAIFLTFAVGGFAKSKQDPQPQNKNSNSTASPQKKTGNRNTGDMAAKGQATAASSLKTQDKNFLMEAAQGGMVEVELGKLAVQKGSSDTVKQFGQKMVDDHSKVNSDLTQIASTKGLTVPSDLDAKHQATITKLSNLSGAAFDRAYAKEMLNDHTKDVAAFERANKSSADPDVKAFVEKTLPTLQEHLSLAKTLNSSMTPSPAKTSKTPTPTKTPGP